MASSSGSSVGRRNKLVIKIVDPSGTSTRYRNVRVFIEPETTLADLREEISNQLDEGTIPDSYYFQYYESDEGVDDYVDISSRQEALHPAMEFAKLKLTIQPIVYDEAAGSGVKEEEEHKQEQEIASPITEGIKKEECEDSEEAEPDEIGSRKMAANRDDSGGSTISSKRSNRANTSSNQEAKARPSDLIPNRAISNTVASVTPTDADANAEVSKEGMSVRKGRTVCQKRKKLSSDYRTSASRNNELPTEERSSRIKEGEPVAEDIPSSHQPIGSRRPSPKKRRSFSTVREVVDLTDFAPDTPSSHPGRAVTRPRGPTAAAFAHRATAPQAHEDALLLFNKNAFMSKQIFHVNPWIDSKKQQNEGFGMFIAVKGVSIGFCTLSPTYLQCRNAGMHDNTIFQIMKEDNQELQTVHTRQVAMWHTSVQRGDFIIMRHEYPMCPYLPNRLKDNGKWIGPVYVIGVVTAKPSMDYLDIANAVVERRRSTMQGWSVEDLRHQIAYCRVTFLRMGEKSNLSEATRRYLHKVCQPTVSEICKNGKSWEKLGTDSIEVRDDLWEAASTSITPEEFNDY